MMLEMEQPPQQTQSNGAKRGKQRNVREETNGGRRCGSRGLICLIVLALVILISKDNVFHLDQFLVVSDSNGESGLMTSANDTILHREILFERRKTALSLSSKQSAQHPPLSCSDIFYKDRNKPSPFGDPNKGGMYARYIKSNPAFWVSLHSSEFDPTRWSIMIYGYYYESVQSEVFTEIVKADAQQRQKQQQEEEQQLETASPQPIRVIDVGGNIGWYSLVTIAAARAQDYPIIIDVFEPNPLNHPRLCESLFLNEWLRHDQVAVNLYPIGVTSNHMVDKSPQGRMDFSTSGRGSLEAMDWQNTTGTITFPLVSLDRMAKELEWNHTISILKVDVEGFELEVFQGAQALLTSQLVQNIFFEGNIRTDEERVKFQNIVKLLLNCGYVAHKVGGYRGPTRLATTVWDAAPVNENDPTAMANRVGVYMRKLTAECAGELRKKRSQCNIWWRPR